MRWVRGAPATSAPTATTASRSFVISTVQDAGDLRIGEPQLHALAAGQEAGCFRPSEKSIPGSAPIPPGRGFPYTALNRDGAEALIEAGDGSP